MQGGVQEATHVEEGSDAVVQVRLLRLGEKGWIRRGESGEGIGRGGSGEGIGRDGSGGVREGPAVPQKPAPLGFCAFAHALARAWVCWQGGAMLLASRLAIRP